MSLLLATLSCSEDQTVPYRPYPVLAGYDETAGASCAVGIAGTGAALYQGYKEYEGNVNPDFWPLYGWTMLTTGGAVTTGWSCAVWYNQTFNDWVYYSCNRGVLGFNPRTGAGVEGGGFPGPKPVYGEATGDYTARFFRTAVCYADGSAAVILDPIRR